MQKHHPPLYLPTSYRQAIKPSSPYYKTIEKLYYHVNSIIPLPSPENKLKIKPLIHEQDKGL
jgi:hypothetical protein